MSLTQSRITAWVAWLCVALAALVWLPRLLGAEPAPWPRRPDRPRAVLLGINPLAEDVILKEVSTPAELQALIPFEAEPEKKVEAPEAPQPPEVVADADSEEEMPQELILKLIPVEQPPLEEELPGQAAPTRPASSLKIVPQLEELPAENLTVPPNPTPVAAPLVGSAVKYWIVSSRCCRQKQHKCGVNCRFVCHAITEDCQCLPVEYEQMMASQIPGAPTCVLVHGSFTRLQDVWPDAECTYNWLRNAGPQVPINFIYYTWPSEGPFAILPHNYLTTPVPNLDFGILGHRAELNGFYLADLIGELPPTTTVSLIGHSLGARTVAAALHLLGGGTVRGQARCNPVDGGHRIRVVLAAAAIEHDWLNPGDRFGCALNRAECLLNLRNECDLALALFPLRRPFSSRSLARAGFTTKDQRELGERLVQVSELDVTPLVGKGHSWTNYCRQPSIAHAITPYVSFEAAENTLVAPEMPR
ncbi:MAG: hypothetical protein IAG10_05225 [Planctomycetaceae bacterium]|nr:hypothetical protein [Planctomycetaceae bacterium]